MPFLKRLVPFMIAGIIIAVLAFGMILFAYVFVIGSIIGLGLFVFNWVRERFFTPKKKNTPKTAGRIIDSDDFRKL